MPDLVLDATPLNHFARAGHLDLLGDLLTAFSCHTTSPVRQELARGEVQYPSLQPIPSLPWLGIVDIKDLEELYVFAEYMNLLGNKERNAGEATVLAWAERNDAIAFVDDMVACNHGRNRGVTVRRSLWFLVSGVRNGLLSENDGQAVARDLMGTGMYLPEQVRTDLFGWARGVGIW